MTTGVATARGRDRATHRRRNRPLRMLFTTTAGAGHFGPLEPFASACRRAGHHVLVAGPAGAAPMVARAGLPFRALGEPTADEIARFRAGQQGLSPMQAMGRAAGELYVRLHGGAALPGMIDTISDWRPDIVVRESAEFSALVAAERLGVPHAHVTVGLSTGLPERMLPIIGAPLDELRARVGLAFREESGAREPRLTLSPASLDDPTGPPQLVRRFRLGTSPVPERPLGGWGDREAPLVYVSFGTEVPSPSRSYFPELYRRVLDAAAELPVRLLVTIGLQRDPGELGPMPPSVRVERWVPNAVALRDATAMIGHGGAGSVLGALTAGVPMVLIPLFADQPLNTRRMAELGAGIGVEDGPALPSDLRSAIEELLADTRYRTRARMVADEITALPPVDQAVPMLEALTASRSVA
jgi:UDP:flavonoid glycosyltransferase YjiC (YdhE family)